MCFTYLWRLFMSKKNMTFEYNHQNLGELIINISSGENAKNGKDVITPAMVIKNKNKDSTNFLYSLYEIFAGSNDTVTDIIGEYLVSDYSALTNEQIAQGINEKYVSLAKKYSAKSSEDIKVGDGINASIVQAENPNDPIYTAVINVKEHNGQLTAYFESQMTREDCRRQGLMILMLNNYIPKFCQENGISSLSGEPVALDGVSSSNLAKMYVEKLGFERLSDGTVVKDVAPVNEM